jgi:hypothetical protein
MLTLIPIITTLVNVLLAALQADGIVSPSISSLVTGLESIIAPLVSKLSSGSGTTSDVLAVLGALSGAITVLKSNTSISGTVLAQINDLDEAVSAALAAYVQAGVAVTPSTLTPITPVV